MTIATTVSRPMPAFGITTVATRAEAAAQLGREIAAARRGLHPAQAALIANAPGGVNGRQLTEAALLHGTIVNDSALQQPKVQFGGELMNALLMPFVLFTTIFVGIAAFYPEKLHRQQAAPISTQQRLETVCNNIQSLDIDDAKLKDAQQECYR